MTTEKRVVHCWMGRSDWIVERFGVGSDEHVASYNEESMTCLREHGHEGEHDFIPDSRIMITFPPQPKSEESQ